MTNFPEYFDPSYFQGRGDGQAGPKQTPPAETALPGTGPIQGLLNGYLVESLNM